mmetsp:Transcript_15917/g.45338  ORF Transcript_15917/g.45338 Transcript_15917/m.45338 type:complete len:279 (+) Transcript_15917:157-993(+)
MNFTYNASTGFRADSPRRGKPQGQGWGAAGFANTGIEADGLTTMFAPLVRSDSMDIHNDPRFFSGNVIDKRLRAFGALGMVSSLVIHSAMSECFRMKKDIDVSTLSGAAQLLGLGMMTMVLFANILAAYVSVAQLYFTYRLMTAGPTGFEMAASYYLNPNLAFWRHLAVKMFLTSLPIFLLGSSFRIYVVVEKDAAATATTTSPSLALQQWHARLFGVSWLAVATFVAWSAWAGLIFFVNRRHVAIFQDLYQLARGVDRPFMESLRLRAERGRDRVDV